MCFTAISSASGAQGAEACVLPSECLEEPVEVQVEAVEMPPQAAAQHLAQRAKFFADIARQIGLQPE